MLDQGSLEIFICHRYLFKHLINDFLKAHFVLSLDRDAESSVSRWVSTSGHQSSPFGEEALLLWGKQYAVPHEGLLLKVEEDVKLHVCASLVHDIVFIVLDAGVQKLLKLLLSTQSLWCTLQFLISVLWLSNGTVDLRVIKICWSHVFILEFMTSLFATAATLSHTEIIFIVKEIIY